MSIGRSILIAAPWIIPLVAVTKGMDGNLICMLCVIALVASMFIAMLTDGD